MDANQPDDGGTTLAIEDFERRHRLVIEFYDEARDTHGTLSTDTPLPDGYSDKEAHRHIRGWITDVGNAGANRITLRFKYQLRLPGEDVWRNDGCDGITAEWDTDRGGWLVDATWEDACEPTLIAGLLDTGVSVYRKIRCWECQSERVVQAFRDTDRIGNGVWYEVE